jgi:hypothetical protein
MVVVFNFMESSSEKKYTCDIFMNEVRMEDEPLLELEENGSIQTYESRNPQTNGMKRNN